MGRIIIFSESFLGRNQHHYPRKGKWGSLYIPKHRLSENRGRAPRWGPAGKQANESLPEFLPQELSFSSSPVSRFWPMYLWIIWGYGDFQVAMTFHIHQDAFFCITELNPNWVTVSSEVGGDRGRGQASCLAQPTCGLWACSTCSATSDLSLGCPYPLSQSLACLLLSFTSPLSVFTYNISVTPLWNCI